MLGYNMFAYCNNNPITFIDDCGEYGEAFATWWFYSLGSFSGATPTGIDDIIWFLGTLIVCGASIETFDERYYNPMFDFEYQAGLIVEYPPQNVLGNEGFDLTERESVKVTEKRQYDPNPYARPGEKKQNRENRGKARKKSGWQPRNNRRDGKPAKVPKHTPSKKGHKKYFTSDQFYQPIKIFWI